MLRGQGKIHAAIAEKCMKLLLTSIELPDRLTVMLRGRLRASVLMPLAMFLGSSTLLA